MSTMYSDYFGFHEVPFLSLRDIRYYYSNPVFDQAADGLREAISSNSGLLLLTGQAGTGKSTLLRKLQTDLEPCCEVIPYRYTSLSWREFLNVSCDALALDAVRVGESAKRELVQGAFRSRARAGKRAVLLIDDAQNLERDVLSNLLGLVYSGQTQELLAPIVFVGTADFARRLAQPEYRQLGERLCVHAVLAPLAVDEVRGYIDSHLEAVGYEGEELFSNDAVASIAACSNGIPQLINITCGAALLAAYENGQKLVTADVVERVLRDWREFEDGRADEAPHRFNLQSLWPGDGWASVRSRCVALLRTSLCHARQAWSDFEKTTAYSRAQSFASAARQRLRGQTDESETRGADDFIIPSPEADIPGGPPPQRRKAVPRWGWIAGLAVLVLAFGLFKDDPDEPQATPPSLTAQAESEEGHTKRLPSVQAPEAEAKTGEDAVDDSLSAEQEHIPRTERVARIRSELRAALKELGTTWEELLVVVSTIDTQENATPMQRADFLDQAQLKTSNVIESLAKLETLSAQTLAELDEPQSAQTGNIALVAKETISTGSADTALGAAGEDTTPPSVEGESLERAEPESTPGELAASFVVEIPAESLVEPVAMTTIETEDFDPPVQHEDAVAKLQDGRWAVDAKSPRAPAPSIADTVLAQPASMGLSNTSVAVPSTVSVEEAPPEAQPQAADVEPTGEPASFVTLAKVQGDAPDETQQAQPHDAHGTLYEVRLGDTLSRIARANGVTPGELAAWNGMLVGDPLYAGRELRLTAPPDDTATGASASMSPEVDGAAGNASGVEIAPEPVELAGSGTLRPSGSEDTKAVEASVARGANLYEVRSGDTLSGISRALDVELTQLTLWNDLRLTDTLHPGQKLRVTKPEEDAMVSATAIQNLDAGPDVSGIEVDTQPGEATEASALDSQLIEASGRGDMPGVVDVLRQGARVDASDDAGNTALIKAAGAGHDSVVGTLLGRGADANLSNAVGETALMAAVWNGQVRVVNTLLRHGVELEAKNSDGWSAIFYGAISGHWGSVRSLIQNGADVDAVTSRGRSPLLAAVWNGHVTVARQLVNAGADVNAEDSEGWTALMAAAYNGEVEAAELLLAHGARVDATANNGEKALTMARQQGNESVVVLLQADNP